jgi:hypothetical protein
VYQYVSEKVAVRVVVHAWSATRAREDEASDVDEGMTEAVIVVGHVCLNLEELIVGRHSSRCDGLLLLALLDSESMSRHAAEGMRI